MPDTAADRAAVNKGKSPIITKPTTAPCYFGTVILQIYKIASKLEKKSLIMQVLENTGSLKVQTWRGGLSLCGNKIRMIASSTPNHKEMAAQLSGNT